MEGILQQLIEQDFGYERGGGVWGRSAKHDSLVLNEETQFWFWNSRGIKGNAVDYLVLVRGMSKSKAREYISGNFITSIDQVSTEEQSPPYDKLVDLMWSNGKNHREYWYSRRLTDETIDKYRLGFFDDWYLIPMYEDGKFYNFQCRRETPDKRIKQWYRNTSPILFSGDILSFVSTIFITEGTVDAMLLTQEGYPAVSQCGTNIWKPEWFSKFMGVNKVYYVEDNDKAGRSASKMISKALGLERVKIISYFGEKEKFDTVDFFRNGGTKESFSEKIKEAKYIYELENIK